MHLDLEGEEKSLLKIVGKLDLEIELIILQE
jgi:hypothetical protein